VVRRRRGRVRVRRIRLALVAQRRLCRLTRLDGLLGLDEVVRRDGDVCGAELAEEDLGEEGAACRLLLDGCGLWGIDASQLRTTKGTRTRSR